MTPAHAFDIHPFFLPGSSGSLFALFYRPQVPQVRGRVLYLPPFAEEMHKSRRMAALQARAFAQAGYAVLQIDLTGCGDSACDFGEATWERWLDDALRAQAWLAHQIDGPDLLWGLRTGGLLATQLSGRIRDVRKLVLWQPVLSGATYLNQFLRIKIAGDMTSTGPRQTTQDLLARLQTGHGVEVGGNLLSPSLAQSLLGLRLDDFQPACSVYWGEVGATLGPASQRVVEQWCAKGAAVQTRASAGPPFWTTQEITECPSMITATLDGVMP